MIMRKAQVTVFIIIGVILVALISLSFAFKDSILEQAGKFEITKGLAMSAEARKVQSDMQVCMKDVTELGLIVMGLQGGYTTLTPRVQYSTESQTVLNHVPYEGTAYSYFKGKNLVPTKETMGKQLATFITTYVTACEPKYEDLEVTYGKASSVVGVQDKKIVLNINMDVKIKKGETESGFKQITTELPVRLGTMQSVVNQIVDKQIKTSEEELCVSCIARIAAENGMTVDVNKMGDDIFYSLNDENSKVAGYYYTFMMANKF
jgi:hypothetical protein